MAWPESCPDRYPPCCSPADPEPITALLRLSSGHSRTLGRKPLHSLTWDVRRSRFHSFGNAFTGVCGMQTLFWEPGVQQSIKQAKPPPPWSLQLAGVEQIVLWKERDAKGE